MPDASVNYNGSGVDYLDHSYLVYFSPTQHADIAGFRYLETESPVPSPGAQENTVAGDFYLGDQDSSADPSYNRDFYGRGGQSFPDTGGAYQLYPATWESLPPLDITPATPMASHETGTWGHAGPPASRPTGGVGNEETTELSAGSPPIGNTNIGSQKSKKRKRATITRETRKAKRPRHRKSQRLDPRGPTQVGILQF